MPNTLLTIKDAARYFKVSEKTLRRWEKKGLLVAVRTSGGHRRYQMGQLQEFKKHKKDYNVLENIPAPEPFLTPRQNDINNQVIFPSVEKTVVEPSTVISGNDHTEQLQSTFSLKSLVKPLGAFAVISFILLGSVVLGKNILANNSKLKLIAENVASKIYVGKSYFLGSKNDNQNSAHSSISELKQKVSSNDVANKVLAATTFSTLEFISKVDSDFLQDVNIAGNLNLDGNTLSAAADLVITANGGGVSIGAGVPTIVDLENGDLFVTDQLEVVNNIIAASGQIAGDLTTGSLTIDAETFTDLTGLGLTNVSGVLTTTIGTTIESAEITNGTIEAIDLNISNDGTDAFVLTYDSSTGAFTWAEDQVGGTSLWTDDGSITYLASTSDDLALGGTTSSAPFYFDVSSGELTLDSLTTDSGGVSIASGQDIDIGGIGLNDVGSSNTTSGAALVGVFDEFTNSSSTTLQDVLDDFDASLGSGASKWAQDTGFIYLTNTTDSVTIGGNTELGKLAVDGDADEVQLLIQGNSTQTSDLIVAENSAGTDQLTLTNDGNLAIAGNFSVNGGTISSAASTLVINAGGSVDIQDDFNADSISTDTGGVTIVSGQDLAIGTIGLNDVGASNTTSGASLIGVFDELANSNSTNLQDVLDDLDAAIAGGATGDITGVGDIFAGDAFTATGAAGSSLWFYDTTTTNYGQITVTANTLSAARTYTLPDATGEISVLGQTIEGSEITDGTLEEADLEVTNSPTDDYILTYDNASGGFEWIDPSAVGVNYWSRTVGVLSPLTSGDVISATSGATTVATFTSTGSNAALMAGSTGNYLTISGTGDLSTAGSITGGAGNFSSMELNSGGITNTGTISGATTINASGTITGGTITDGTASLTGGALAGVTDITASGTITFSGLTADRAVFTDSSSQLVSSAASSVLANSITDETGTGALVLGTSPTFTTDITVPTIISSGDLTLNPGDEVMLADTSTFIVGGHVGNVAYNVISDAGGSPLSGQINSDDDLYVEGAIEAGSVYQGANQVCDTSGNCAGGLGGSKWQRDIASASLAPLTATDNIVLGGNTTTVFQLEVNGSQVGKALVSLNETGDQNILTASASGTTVFNLTRAGFLQVASNGGLDTLTAGGNLLIGNSNTGSLSICNSANCDTITIGTNSDADTITIGEINDDISITDANWSINSAGVAAFTQTNTDNTRLDGNTLSITNSGGALTLDVNSGETSGEDLIITSNNITLDATGALTITPDASLTTAIDLTDSDLTNALSIANHNITGTTYSIIGTNASIDFSEFDVDSGSGSVIINDNADAGNVNVEGTVFDINSLDFVGTGAITTGSGDLTLNPVDEVVFGDTNTLIIGGHAGNVAYNALSDIGGSPTSGQIDSDDDLYVEGAVEASLLYQGANQVCDTSGNCSSLNNYWQFNSDAIAPGTAAPANSRVVIGGNTTTPFQFEVNGTQIGKALVSLNETGGDQNILTASASGTTVFNLTRAGNLQADGVFSFGTSTPSSNAYNTIGSGTATGGGVNNGSDLYITDSFEVDGSTYLDGLLDSNGDVTIADTNIAFDGASTTFTTTGAFTLTPGGAVLLGDGGDTLQLNSSDWDISTTGDLTGIGGITADGAISFSPSSTSGITFNLDADSLFTLASTVSTADSLVISPNHTAGTSFTGSLTSANLTADRTWTLPNNTGTVCLDTGNCAGVGGVLGGTGTAGQIAFFTSATNVTSEISGFSWDESNDRLGIGTDSPLGKLHISGASTGKALTILNETGDQNILTASASGVTVMNLDRSGNLSLLTQGDARFYDSDNSNYVGFQGPTNVTTDVTYTLPDHNSAAPSGDYVLTWQSGNALEWKSVTSVGGAGDITAVGNITSGDAFTSGTPGSELYFADNAFLGLGSTSGRIEFDDQTVDELNILSAKLGIGTSTPTSLLHTTGAVTGKALAIFDETGDQNIITASASGTTVLNLTRQGDLTAGFTVLNGSSTTNGTGSNSKNVILSDASSFEVGNYILLSDTNCESGVNSCYAKIASKAGNTISLDHSLTWSNGVTVTEYHIPEVGGTNTASTVTDRYGRGYFISGIVTGSGSTTYTDQGIFTSDITGGNSAGLSMTTGNTTTSGNSGSITIDTGSAAGTAGTITIGGINASAVNIGRSGITTTLSGNLDLNNNLILNVGDSGTDFTSGGGLTLAGTLIGNGQFTLGDNGETGSIDTTNWDVSAAGVITATQLNIDNIRVDGNTLSSTSGNITLDSNTGSVFLGDTDVLTIGGHAGSVAYNVISDSGGSPASGQLNSDNDLFIQGTLEAGAIYIGANQVCDSSNNCAGTNSFWSRNANVIYPGNAANDGSQVAIGTGLSTTPFQLGVSGSQTGKALIGLNETGDQNILTASASGATVANLDRNGNLTIEGSIADLSGTTLLVNDNLDVNGTTGITASGNDADLTFSGSSNHTISASGGTLQIGAAQLTGTLDANANLITNIGDANTDFTSGGGLTLAGALIANGSLTANSTFVLGDGGDAGSVDTSDWDISGTGDLTGIGGITADGAISFTPGSALDIIFGVDTDSVFTLDSSVANADNITISPNNSGSNTFAGIITSADITATDKTWTFPDSSGTVCLSNGNCASTTTYWQLNANTLAPGNAASVTDKLVLGGNTSTNFQFEVSGAQTGKALAVLNETGDQNILAASASGTNVAILSRTGNLTLTSSTSTADSIRVQPGSSAGAAFTGIITSADLTGTDKTWTFPDATGTVCLSNGNCAGTTNYWQLNSNVIAPGNAAGVTDRLALGGSTSTDFQLGVSGAVTGKALVGLNETGNQNIITASASGTNVFNLTRAGSLQMAAGQGIDTLTSGSFNIGAVTASSVGIGRTSATTTNFGHFTLTSGRTLTVNGDAFTDLTGNGLQLSSNALTLRTVSATDALSATTSTGSGLEVLTTGLSLLQGCANSEILKWNESNDSWECGTDAGAASAVVNVENNDVNVGSIDTLDFGTDFLVSASPATEANISIADDILDFTELKDSMTIDATSSIAQAGFDLNLTGNGKLGVGTASPVSKFHLTNSGLTAIGKSIAIFDQNEAQDIFTASASGVTRFTLENDGDLALRNGETIGNQTNGTVQIGRVDTGALTLSLLSDTSATISNTTGDITLNAAGSRVNILDPINVGGATGFNFNFFSTSLAGNNIPDDANDLFIQDELEVEGSVRFDIDGADTFTVANSNNTSGGAVSISLDNTSANLGSNALSVTLTNDDDVNAVEKHTGAGITMINNGTSADDTLYALEITNSNASTADLDAGIRINNQDSAQLISDAILIESSGGGGITRGINFNDTDIVTELVLQNDEAIDNDTDNTIVFSSNASNGAGVIRLPVKTTTGDPALNVEGNMYYNTTDNRFRCFQDSTWVDCISSTASAGGWTDDGTTVRLTGASDFVAIGAATADGKLGVVGARDGQALAILNETGDQNILSASASGTTQFNLTRTGTLEAGDLTLGLDDGDATITTFDTNEDLTIDPNGSGNITLTTGSTLDINASSIDLSTQAANIDLINSNASALTFESNLLRLDTSNTSVEVTGTTNLGDGGTTNYAQFSATGDLTFNGSADTITGPGTSGLAITNAAGNIGLTTTTSGDVTVGPNTATGTGDDLFLQDGTVTSAVPLTVADTGLDAGLTQGIIDAINDVYGEITGNGGNGLWRISANIINPNNTTHNFAIGGNSSSAPLYFDTSAELLTLTNTTSGNSFVVNDQAGDSTPFMIDQNGVVTVGSTLTVTGNSLAFGNGETMDNSTNNSFTFSTNISNADKLVLQPQSGTATNTFSGIITSADLTGSNKTWTFPNASGDVCLTSGNCSGVGGVGDVTGNGTAGQISYFTDTKVIASESTGFAWDATNNKLGIGDDTPEGVMDIEGAATGKALFQLNETGDQDILAASASGTTRARITNGGNLYLTGTLNTISGNLTIDSAGGTTTIADNTAVTGTSDLQGNVSNSTGSLTIADNAVITGTTDLQSAVSSSTGNIILSDTVDIGSSTTGLRVDTAGQLIDIDGSAIAINDGLSFVGSQSITTTSNGNLTFAPNGTGDIIGSVDTDTLFTLDSSVTNGDNLVVSPNNTGTGSEFTGTITTANLTANRTYTFPDFADGEVCLTSGNCAGVGGTGDITAVGSTASGDAFADSTADDDWLGLGASAGRIEFDDQTVDEVNILSSKLGIGTSAPTSLLHVDGTVTGKALTILNDTGTDQNVLSASASGTTIANLDRSGNLSIEGYIEDLGTSVLTINDDLKVGGNDILDSSDTTRLTLGSTTTVTATTTSLTGDLTVQGGDITLNTAGTIIPSAAGTITIGNGSLQSLTVTTDGTGNGEVILPTGSISGTEILDDTITASDLSAILTFADGDFLNLSAINTSSSSEGFILPQNTNCASGTAEGQICWDSDTEALYVGTGSGAQLVGGAGGGDITSVGSMTSGDVFSDTSADDDWLGLGASAGRIEFDDQTYDEVNILSAKLGLGTATPTSLLHVDGTVTGKALAILNDTGTDQNIFVASASGTNVLSLSRTGVISLNQASQINTGANTLTLNSGGAGTIQFYSSSNTVDSSGNLTLAGDITVNGGDIVAPASTFNIANAATTLNLGTTNIARTINIGTGTNADTINIGTGGTTSETITIGSAVSGNSLSLTDDSWNISGAGAANFASIGATTRGTALFTTLGANSTVSFTGLSSGTGSALCLDGSNNVITCTVGAGGVSGSGTSGQISFFNGSTSITSETSGFAWDATNNKLGIGDDTPDGLVDIEGAAIGQALLQLRENGDQNIITASAAGTTVFNLNRTGNLQVAAGQGLDTLAAGALALGNTNATSVSLCNSANCDTINIGNLSTTDADSIIIGEVLDDVSITDANWSISSAGVSTFTQTNTDNTRLDGNTLSTTNSGGALTLDVHSGDAAGEDLIITSNNVTLLATGALSITPDSSLTTAIDLTDAQLTNALSIANHNITGTTYSLIGTNASIDFAEFDVIAANGSIVINDNSDLGSITIENTVLDKDSLDFSNVGAGISVSSGDLTLNPGDEIVFSDTDTFIIGGHAGDVAYNVISDAGGAPASAPFATATDDDLFVEGTFEAGAIYQGANQVCDTSNNCAGVGGDITAVGNISSGDAFTSGTPGSELYFATSGFLGIGASSGRIVFTDTTTDIIDIEAANLDLNANTLTGTTAAIDFTNFDVASTGLVTLLGGLSPDITTQSNNNLTIQPGSTGRFIVNTSNTSASALDLNATGTVAGAAITLDTTNGGIALSAAGSSNGDITLTAGDDTVIQSNVDTGNTTLIAGDNSASALANGNDIELRAEDDFILNFAAGSNATFDAATVDSTNNSTTAGVFSLIVDASISAASATNYGYLIDYQTIDDADATDTFIAQRINVTGSSVDNDLVYGLSVNNVNDASGAATDALITLENNDANTSVTDGIVFLAGGATAPDFTTGINFDAADFTTEIVLENGETIDNQTDNRINLGLGASGTLRLTSSTTATIDNSAGALAINAQATGLNLQADGSIDVNLAGGSGSTGCTVANSTGNLSCTGDVTVTGNDITFGNGETISNATNGVLAFSGTTNATVIRLPSATSVSEASLDSTAGNMYYDSTNNKYRCRTGSGWVDCDTTGSGPWTDGSGITYLTDTAEDLAVGSTTLVAPFSVDESTNTVRIGEGSGSNATLNMFASGGQTGSIAYTTSDEWNFTGGGINLDSYLDLDSTSATAFTLGDGTNNYITFDGSTDASDTLLTINSASSGITSGNGLSVLSDTQTTGTGMLLSVDALTTGSGLLIDNAANTLTTGTLFQVQSSATSLTTAIDGFLGYFDWSPGTSTKATGDLFRLNIGPNGDATNLFNITDNGSSVFAVAENQITSAVPHQFTAAGDVAMAYDLILTNQTSGNIQSYGPLTITSGESFENNNLTLAAYGTGNVILDPASTGYVQLEGATRFNSQLTLANDATPDVSGGTWFVTGGTTTITDFDAGSGTLEDGHMIVIEANHAVTIDTEASTEFFGSNTDIVLADNDIVSFIYDATEDIWRLLSWADDSSAGGHDIAEYFPSTQNLTAGEVVKVDPENPEHVIRSASAYESSVVGIVTTNPGIVMGTMTANSSPIALAGRVPVKISSSSQSITPGDYITTSSEPGKATKATGNGRVIGQALEDWDANSGKSEVIVFINNTWYEPVQLSDSGDVSGVKLAADPNNPGFALLTDPDGNVVNKLSGLVSLLADNIKSSYAEITQLVTGSVRTKEIATAPNEKNIEIKIGKDGGQTGFGKLLIKNAGGEVAAEIDESGNATFAGEVTSDSITTTDATVSGQLAADTIRAGRIYADEIVGLDAKFASAAASTVRGISRDEIEEMLRDFETDQDALTDAGSWTPNTATGSASLNEMALENLYVTGQSAFRALSLTENMVIGSDMVMASSINGGQRINSIDTVSAPLSIQSSGSQPIFLMAGLVQIDTQGNMTIAGDLNVAGSVNSSSLTLTTDAENLTGFGKLLSIVDSLGSEVAGITATGSATFASIYTGSVAADKFEVKADVNATSSATLAGATYESNATAGTATIPAGLSEVTINNTNIKGNSLVFVTPTSGTGNFVIYIKEQTDGQIKVGFDSATETEIGFNWWIVGITASR